MSRLTSLWSSLLTWADGIKKNEDDRERVVLRIDIVGLIV